MPATSPRPPAVRRHDGLHVADGAGQSIADAVRHELDLAYVADPGGGKIEILEWTGLWKALPGEPRLEGVNHVAFGVADMQATREFYGRLGFATS